MLQESRDQLIKIAEKTALKHNLTIYDALERVVNDRANFELLLAAMGNHYKGHPPTRQTLRNWIVKRKDHPAYITPSKRPKTYLKQQLETGKTVTQLAEELGVTRQTIYNRLNRKER
ncbi:hypothetical protein DQW77_17460 [Roseovarius sp. TE539]|uniref:helix-turn-helix domain-containing protein n=1 Tax=Roseovarius sp. TE539 TaxID=2249812 RepID=UPI000DDCA489|nr:HTH domain-containing protein [Roseovarius sp. TE539]RBI67549.1 hypothetical protein DQW77_17460 [Roseovarius sp. TE539]